MGLVNKYAPQLLDELVGRESEVKVLKAKILKGDLGHILFYGKQGTGKTTMTFCLKNELFGEDWIHHWFDINSSHESGVEYIRETVTRYATMAVPLINGKKIKRIIFLDEADYLTPNAQAVLRRLMEDTAETITFILSCNFVDKIIAPIRSRCQEFACGPIATSLVTQYIKWIATEEGKTITDDNVAIICKLAQGDMRKALNLLESVFDGKELSLMTDSILNKSLPEIINMSYLCETDLLFQKLHEECLTLATTGKYMNVIPDVFMSLAESEFQASMARIKVLQFQAAVIKIKRIFQSAK